MTLAMRAEALESMLRVIETAGTVTGELRDDPRYVDWGSLAGAVECPSCGRKGMPFGAGWGPISERNPMTSVVHGGIPFDHDPYGWFFGKRPKDKWEGTLAIREQHDFGAHA